MQATKRELDPGNRNDAMELIRESLKRRSGHSWSVTHDRGTASGWIHIDVPPRMRKWRFIQTRYDVDGFAPPRGYENPIYMGDNAVTPGYAVGPFASGQFEGEPITKPEDDPWVMERVRDGKTGCLMFNWEVFDPSYDFGHMGPMYRKALAQLLGLEHVHCQGESVPASMAHRREYVDRAQTGRAEEIAERYWD